MDSYGDPFGEHDPLGIDAFSDEQQLLSPQPGLDGRGLRSPTSLLGLSSQLPAAGVSGAAAEWGPSPAVIPRNLSVDSFPDIAAHSIVTNHSNLLARGSPSGLGDTGQHLSGVPSPTTAWLTTTNSWGQQLPPQQLSSDAVRQSYRDSQRMIASSQGFVEQQWAPQDGHQQRQVLPHAMMPVGGSAPMPLVPVSSGIGNAAAASAGAGTKASQAGPATASQVALGQDHTPREQQQRVDGARGPGTNTSDLWQHQPQQPQQHQQQQRQQQQQSSLPDSAPHHLQSQQQPFWPSLMPQQQNTASKAASGAGSGKKKSSKGGSESSSRKPPAAAAAAALDFSGLWKPPPQPKEARLPKEPGVDYEDILPPGLDAASTRPLQVPADLLQLEDLNSVLSIDTWSNVLDEQDRAQLRSFLPLQRAALNESSEHRSGTSSTGGKTEPLGLADLLSGQVNFCFGNPLAKLWNDIVAGTATPRLRRQHETVLQLRQQLAAAHLRDYHNTQVSTLLQMQRLWSAQLPADASTAERLALWKAAQHGDVGFPKSPAAAAAAGGQDDEEEQEDAADAADGAADMAVDVADVTDDEDHVVGGGVDVPATLAPAPPQLSVDSASRPVVGHASTGPTAVQPQQHLQQAFDGLPSSSATNHQSTVAGDQGPHASHNVRLPAAAGATPATAAAAIAAAMGPSPGSAAAGVQGLGTRQHPVAPWQAPNASRQHPSIGQTFGAAGTEMGPKPSVSKTLELKNQRAAAAAASKVYSAIGASRQNVYVYEGPVDFSKKLTKRQAAAAAAAAGQQGPGSRDASPGQEAQ